MTIEVRFLGTASGLPAVHRFGQTIVLTNRNRQDDQDSGHYILDTGDGASSLLMRHSFDHRRIRGIFISHMHADHHGGFAQVVKTSMHIRKRDELVVLAPAEGIPALKAYMEASYLFDDWLGFPIRWVPLTECVDGAYTFPDGLTLRAYPNEHLSSARRNIGSLTKTPQHTHAFESYSAVCEWDGARIVYSGNLNGPTGADEMAAYVEPCDLLIAELAHVDPTELGRFLAGRDIRQTVITHYEPDWDALPSQVIRDNIERGAGTTGIRGLVTLGQDGDVFNLTTDHRPPTTGKTT